VIILERHFDLEYLLRASKVRNSASYQAEILLNEKDYAFLGPFVMKMRP
jgi:hypothetical protein